MAGSYAVGDVRALVPARKAVWSLGKLSSFYSFYALSLFYISPFMMLLFFLSYYFISHILLYDTSTYLPKCWYFCHESSSLFHHSVLADLSVSMMMH